MPIVDNFMTRAWRRYRLQTGPRREITTALLGAAVGLFVVPLAIWLGGQLVMGPYQLDPVVGGTGRTGGPVALWLDYAGALLQGSVGYWIAFAFPYVIYLLVRFGIRIGRA